MVSFPGLPPRVVQFKDQDFKKIRANLIANGGNFEDPLFPASESSLGSVRVENVVWKRPAELSGHPRLLSLEDTSPGVIPGLFSSPWFVSALSLLSAVPELRFRVVPESILQEWPLIQDAPHSGIFVFRFWHFGDWIEVVVDDLLPTADGKLLFSSSRKPSEYWPSLLEKAYAKLHGSYDGLLNGHLADALVDLTGGVVEVMEMASAEGEGARDRLVELTDVITKELADHSLLCLRINLKPGEEYGSRTEMGLHRGHIHQVTGARHVALAESRLQQLFSHHKDRVGMIRLRDLSITDLDAHPQGSEPGSPDSGKGSNSFAYPTPVLAKLLSRNPKWAQVRDTECQRMGLAFQNDGEFWMPSEDLAVFDEMIVVRFYTNNAFALLTRWREWPISGRWTTGLRGTSMDRSGGSPEFTETFLRNPQYKFDISGISHQTIVLQLLQWQGDDRRKFVSSEELPLLIGLSIIKVEENRKFRLLQQWDFHAMVVEVPVTRKRQLYYHGMLSPGRYIIIPHTYRPEEAGGFHLRAIAQANIKLKLLKKDRPPRRWPHCIFNYPSLSTVVLAESATGVGNVDSWLQFKCEGKKETTSIARHSSTPSWNVGFIFYRCHSHQPIKVKMYCRRWTFFHSLLGEAELPALENQRPTPLTVILHDQKGGVTSIALNLRVLTDNSVVLA